MPTETATFPQLVNEYTAASSESARLGFLVRDTELQLHQIDSLTTLKDRIRGFKRGAVRAGNEQGANALFHLQCCLNAQISFLQMWVHLKKGDYYPAWDNLMDAEEYVSIALRAADIGVSLEDFLEHLKRTEQVVFPGYNVYNSSGMIIRGGKCSVCDKLFTECDHVEGLVYWGRLCARIHPDIVRVDHVAIVDEPRDRRCVITELTTDDGYYRDYMTWRKTRKAEEREEGTVGAFTGTVFHNDLAEID